MALVNIEDSVKHVFQTKLGPEEVSEGDMVAYSPDGEEESGIAQVERVEDDYVVARIMASAEGGRLEPTDDVRNMAYSDIRIANEYASQGKPAGHDEDDDNPDKNAITEGVWVKFRCVDGDVYGNVVEVSESEEVVIPDTGEKHMPENEALALIEVYQHKTGGWEDTGIHVAHPVSRLSITDKLEEAPKKIVVKMRDCKITDEAEDDNGRKIGTIEGLASAYGKVDLGGDTVEPGAYKQTLQHNNGKFQLMFDHGFEVADTAGIAEASDTEEGLAIKGRMPLVSQKVRDNFEIIKFMQEEGKPIGLSIGYTPIKEEPGDYGVRRLKEIALHEISLTPYPMDTHARIRDAKNRKKTYYSKRHRWQALANGVQTEEADAPTSSQNAAKDAAKALFEAFNHK